MEWTKTSSNIKGSILWWNMIWIFCFQTYKGRKTDIQIISYIVIVTIFSASWNVSSFLLTQFSWWNEEHFKNVAQRHFWLIALHYSLFDLSCSLITCLWFTLFNPSINENLSINKWCTLYWSREKYFVNRFHITITILFENRFRYFTKLSFRVHGFYYKIC